MRDPGVPLAAISSLEKDPVWLLSSRLCVCGTSSSDGLGEGLEAGGLPGNEECARVSAQGTESLWPDGERQFLGEQEHRRERGCWVALVLVPWASVLASGSCLRRVHHQRLPVVRAEGRGWHRKEAWRRDCLLTDLGLSLKSLHY